MTARLLDLEAAAAYLSLSTSALRGLIERGHLKPVKLPAVRSTEPTRRVLLDRADLDSLIESCKEPTR